MNVIEALFITLSLDTSDYEKKQKGVITSLTKMGEASDKQTKLIAESGKKAAQTFSLLKVEVLGALAAFGMSTGFKSFIESSMNGQAALGRLSGSLGMSTQSLQAWKLMAKEMGGSGEEAIGTLQKVASGLASARRGDMSFLTVANKYGAGLDITKDTTQSAMGKINKMASAIRQKYGEQQAMGVLNEMGISGFVQQQRLMEDPNKFAADYAHAMSLTGAATKASTEQAAKLQMQWADLQERFRQVGERVFNKLEPILARLGERLANWLDSINWQDVINKIGRFIDKVQEVVKELGGWKTIAEVLGGVLALKLLSPLLGLIGGFMRLIPLLGSATAGFAGLGAAAGPALAILIGGAGGWAIGKQIDKHLSAGTKDAIGSAVAHMLAFFGNDEAKAAIQDTHLGELRAMASQNAPKIGSDFLGKYDPQHSRQFGGNNAGMFAILEKEYGLPPGTLARKFQVESANGTRLVSKAGALGPMQFMPATAAAMGLGDNVMDLDASAKAAAQYMQQLHSQFGDWDKANAAYNWGPGNLKKDVAAHGAQWLNFAPGETQKYVAMHRLLQSASPSSSFAKRQGPTTNTSTVSINTLNVNTKATDANGVAKGMKTAMQA